MPVPIPPATPSTPPVAPQRTEPTTFSARMDAWLAWFNASFWVWVYDLVPWIQARANETEAWSNTASASAAAAGVSQATAAEAITVANAAMVTVTQQAAAAAATSGTISSVAAAASASASSASASSTAASVSAERAVQAWAAAAAPIEQLASISKSLHVGTVVKSVIYDTSKDSDGGAWRKRMQDKSWYNETLGGNAWIGQQPSEAVARAYVGSLASPQLVVNGTFDTDTSGWTSYQGGILSVSANRLLITNDGTGTNSGSAYQSFTTIIGRVYVFTYTSIAGTTGAATARVGTTIGGSTLATQSGIGTYTLTFTATTTSTFVTLYTNDITASRTVFFDNISVKIVDTAIPTADYLYQSTADGKFYKTVSTSGVAEVRRGISREFPAQVAIVAESLRVVIYDLTQASCPMWMVFVGGDLVTGGALSFDQSTGSSANFNSSLVALNGSIFISQNNAGNGQGLRSINFITEFTDRVSDSARLNTWRFKGNISRRNNVDGGYQYSSVGLVGLAANDVAVVALDTAPIDPSTGLPVPTIAVATAGGVSVIKDDGTVVNSSQTERTDSVGFVGSTLFMGNRYATATPSRFQELVGIAAGWTPTNGMGYLIPGGAEDQSQIIPTPQYMLYRNGLGFSLTKFNKSAPDKSMRARITATVGAVSGYNSGWQVGDSRLAALADTTAETITASGELVTNGTFTTDTSGWTVLNGATFVQSAGAAVLTIAASQTFGGAYIAVSCVVGRSYFAEMTVTPGTASSATLRVSTSTANAGDIVNSSTASSGRLVANFVATQSTHYIAVLNGGTATQTTTFDNISVKLAEPDRSVKNKGLVINGSLTKTAVASGANLVAYSGFSAANYLEQPYNFDLDFGTGDFCVMGWVNPTSLASLGYLFGRQNSGATGSRIYAYVSASTGAVNFTTTDGTTSATVSGGAVSVNSYSFIVCVKSGANLYLYVNSAQVAAATAPTLTLSNTTAVFRSGVDHIATNALSGSLALWRISATAPSADQIAHIYRTELPLFQPNAQCTLAGTSTAVTALAYDDVADELHVGTSWGRSEFKDLLRVASEATTTGAITSLSANEGVVINAGTSAKIYAPALYLRDELRRTFTASRALAKQLMWQEFYATEGQTTFTCSKNGDVRAVYVNNILRKAPVDYTVSSDGFQNIITFTSGISAGIQVSVQTTRS